MTIGILAVGSQGDVQPMAALGVGLVRQGRRVRLMTHASFEGLANLCGLEFFKLAGDPLDIVRGPEGQAWLGSGGNSLLFLHRFARIARSLIDELLEDALTGGRGCDGLVYSLPLAPIGFTVAEVLGIPGIPASLYPIHPTSEFPSVLATRLPVRGPGINRLSGSLVVTAYCKLIRSIHGEWRRKAGLPRFPNLLSAFDRLEIPYLYGYSPSVIPTPSDWKGREVVCGYWFLPPRDDWRPPKELLDFLDGGSPPVYVGFGSMAVSDAEAVTSAVVEALRRTAQRAILSTGWGGLAGGRLPENIMPLSGYVPHEWLFPRVSAVVHHGGAGTTATALRVGVPSVVVPFFADQFFWGATVKHLGVGSQPLPRKLLTAERLEVALREVLDKPDVAQRALHLSRSIGREDGVTAGAEAIGRYLCKTARRTSA